MMKPSNKQITNCKDFETLITYMKYKGLSVNPKGLQVDNQIHRTSLTNDDSSTTYIFTDDENECSIDSSVNNGKRRYRETEHKGCYQLNPGNPITGRFETNKRNSRCYVTVGGGQ